MRCTIGHEVAWFQFVGTAGTADVRDILDSRYDMKLRVFMLLLVALPAAAQLPRAAVDPRVELMSIIFRLAGNGEYNQCRVPTYDSAITRWFEPFKDHEAVQMARRLREHDGIGYDAVMSIAVHVKDIRTLAERVPFDSKSSRLDSRWHGAKARAFLASARRFVTDSQFQKFLDSQAPLYLATTEALKLVVDRETDFSWFEKFFGSRAGARFYVVSGLANGGGSYGPNLRAEDGIEESYLVIGVWRVDSSGRPDFDKSIVSTIVHEGAHSYANPAIEKVLSKIDQQGGKLFEAEAAAMRKQAYSTGRTVLAESLVRACTARYVLAHDGVEAAQREIEGERRQAFIWTGELFKVLGEYENDRAKYPTLDSFMPRVVDYFNDLSPRVGAMVKAVEAGMPKVVSIEPSNGSMDVDPSLTRIVVRFDRPMNRGHYSVMKTSDEHWPPVAKAGFDQTGTIFTMEVSLKPGSDYEFSLNSAGGGNFTSADGTRLEAVPVRFRTK